MLPAPGRNGLILADIRVDGHWDGILVIDGNHRCVGIYIGWKVIDWTLPFAPTDIEAYRKASVTNRILSFVPSELLGPYGWVWFGCPALILLSAFVSYWLLLTVPVLAVICIRLMYSQGGFPLIRPISAMWGISVGVSAIMIFTAKLRKDASSGGHDGARQPPAHSSAQ